MKENTYIIKAINSKVYLLPDVTPAKINLLSTIYALGVANKQSIIRHLKFSHYEYLYFMKLLKADEAINIEGKSIQANKRGEEMLVGIFGEDVKTTKGALM